MFLEKQLSSGFGSWYDLKPQVLAADNDNDVKYEQNENDLWLNDIMVWKST